MRILRGVKNWIFLCNRIVREEDRRCYVCGFENVVMLLFFRSCLVGVGLFKYVLFLSIYLFTGIFFFF